MEAIAAGAKAPATAPPATAPSATEPPASGRGGPPSTSGPPSRTGPSTSGGAATDDGDALTQAIADLTGDGDSLVEALDDLGDPAAYSAPGYTRMSALAAELAAMRMHVARPLADLVGEVERALSLDIEVASRPGSDPAAARADLDAFAGTAAAFGTDQEEATLGAFLAYLTAAQEEEFGLEAGRVGETDTVKLVTVHAAKGLQWPAVVVPGLSAGDRSQLFPAKPRLTTRWTENPRLLPFDLRGDSADLPPLGGLDRESVMAFTQACSERELSEERRLMYVAVTRAAFWLCCSGYWWGDGLLPLGPSVFLEEIAEACRGGAGDVARWTSPPGPDAQNPALAEPAEQSWPVAPAGPRYEAVRAAAALVESALAAAADQPGERDSKASEEDSEASEDRELTEQDQVLAAAWERDATLLLTERDRRRTQDAETVELPGQLSVSALVTLARDAGELARQVRRPMPAAPAPQARRGTAFHRWLQQHFASQRLIDPADLLGLADVDEEADADLAALRAQFDDGAWAHRWPEEVEVPFETRIGDRLIRGRIDAVFSDAPEGGYDVVDWKTGRPPASAEERRAVAVQLAAYRLAWAALAGVPVGQVRAAFYYVRHDMTVSPADLLDAAGLTALIENIPESALP
jgi:DNA helicase-2/ATP-dependent DNA helicase PcrA